MRLTDLLGARVRGGDGRPVGRLVDVVVRYGGPAPSVVAVIVRSSGDRRRFAAAVVRSWDDRPIVLDAGAVPVDDPVEPPARELYLGRDVLDTQIVDVRGHRVVRVGDVLLIGEADGQLVAAAVDVGIGAVARRLGLRWIGARLAAAVVPWESLHLTSRRGHAAQLETPDAVLHHLSPDELAHLLTRLSTAHARDVLQAAPGDRAALAIANTHPEVGGRILSAMDPGVAGEILSGLPPEHRSRWHEMVRRSTVPRRRFRRHPHRRRPPAPRMGTKP